MLLVEEELAIEAARGRGLRCALLDPAWLFNARKVSGCEDVDAVDVAASARGEPSLVTALTVAGVDPEAGVASVAADDDDDDVGATLARRRVGEEAGGRSSALATMTPFSATTS